MKKCPIYNVKGIYCLTVCISFFSVLVINNVWKQECLYMYWKYLEYISGYQWFPLRTGIGEREEKEQTKDFFLSSVLLFAPKIVNIGYFRETLKNIFKIEMVTSAGEKVMLTSLYFRVERAKQRLYSFNLNTWRKIRMASSF